VWSSAHTVSFSFFFFAVRRKDLFGFIKHYVVFKEVELQLSPIKMFCIEFAHVSTVTYEKYRFYRC
jgi:hypothetical protein